MQEEKWILQQEQILEEQLKQTEQNDEMYNQLMSSEKVVIEQLNRFSLKLERQKYEIDKERQEKNLYKELIESKDSQSKQIMNQFIKQKTEQFENQQKDLHQTVERNLQIIEKLIQEKNSLNNEIDNLQEKQQKSQEKMEKIINKLKEDHQFQISNLKDQIIQNEKIKREKWVQEKTKEIKNNTIKGLEPQLEKMIEKHSNEIKNLKTKQRQEIDKITEEYEAIILNLKKQKLQSLE